MKVVIRKEAKRFRRGRINDYMRYGVYNHKLSEIKAYVRKLERADGYYQFMPYQQYIREIEHNAHDKITFNTICSLIASDKFRQAALKAIDSYSCEYTAEEAIYQAFEYLQAERGLFSGKTKEYFRDYITLRILENLR